MLPHQAHQAILDALPSSVWVPVGKGAFPDNPDASEWEMVPEYRWASEDFEDDTAPYEHVTLNEQTGGVIESDQPIDKEFGSARLDDPDIDADVVVRKGSFVYDVLNITVSTAGSDTRAGLTLAASERAHALMRAVYHHFLYEWETRPLDSFDRHGNATDDELANYAGELAPPIRVDAIPGQGPKDTTDMVDANGAQYNAGVELHYVDSVLKYQYAPESVETTVTTKQ